MHVKREQFAALVVSASGIISSTRGRLVCQSPQRDLDVTDKLSSELAERDQGFDQERGKGGTDSETAELGERPALKHGQYILDALLIGYT